MSTLIGGPASGGIDMRTDLDVGTYLQLTLRSASPTLLIYDYRSLGRPGHVVSFAGTGLAVEPANQAPSAGTLTGITETDNGQLIYDLSQISLSMNTVMDWAIAGDNAAVVAALTALADDITGTDLPDHLFGGNGDDRLAGGAGGDTLLGEAGNDRLDGGAGADRLEGGSGNDTYLVDHAADVLIETAAAGIDTVLSSVSHTLGANLENLTLTGAAASNATGNALNNVLIGNAASNVLSAGAGNDRLIGGGGTDTASYVGAAAGVVVSLALTTAQSTGGAGTDTLMGIENLVGSRFNDILTGSAGANALTGGPGDDRLDGGAGADRLAAGAGNDRYVVDHAGDVVLESEGAGTDTVRSGVDYTLAANVENLVLEATAGLAGTGNALANTLTGNAGSNLLRGGPGADLLLGGAGTDALAGGTGADTLTGGLGSDRFVLGSVAESPPGARDVIGDFSAAQRDRLDLAALDANATAAGDQAFLFIGGAAFSGAGQARFAGGLLQVNVDADLAADLEVQLLGVGSLAAADLLL